MIERRLENLLELDYPPELARDRRRFRRLDRSHRRARRARSPHASRASACSAAPRGGKVAAQNRAVRETSGEIVAFSDANATWAAAGAAQARAELRRPRRRLRLRPAPARRAPNGTNREGAYWRYELSLREAESQLDSVTGGNGSIYAVRRSDYVDVDPRFGHDLAFPYLMVQRGRRAVYEPEAVAFEKPTPTTRTSTGARCACSSTAGLIVLRGRMLRGLDPLYLAEIVSHRHLRYALGPAPPRPRSARAPPCAGRAPSTPSPSPASSRSSRSLAARRRRPAALLHARDLGDRRGARRLPSLRRAGGVGESGGNAVTRDRGATPGQELACPRDRSRARAERRDASSASTATSTRIVDGIPVLVRRRRRADAAGLLGEAGADRARPRRRAARGRGRRRSTRTSPS